MLRYLAFLFLISGSIFAEIKEIAHFSELATHADPDTVILLDIDDTLIAPIQMLGSDTWFEYRLKKNGGNLEKTLAEWEALRHLSQMQLVEPDIAQILAAIQKSGVPILGVTVQGLALATRTVLQLREQDVDLSLTTVCNEDRCLSVQGHTVLYRQGILFTSGKPKGESFFQLCEKTGQWPKRVVVVDDKLSHLQSFEKEAEKRGVEFIGLRYAFSDARKAAFSPEIADYQLAHSTLTHLVSDNEAKEGLNLNERFSELDSSLAE